MSTEREAKGFRRTAALPRLGRCRGDAGAVIAEAALLTPVFITILFGLLEFGGAFRDYLTLNNGSNAAARQESIAANQTDADQLTLDAIKQATSAFPVNEITKIVVFYASGPRATVPAACLSGGSQSNLASPRTNSVMCNVYTPAIYPTSSTTNWGSCAISDPDHYFCPTNRLVSVTAPPDYVGVYIEMVHPWITGLFGNSITFTKTSVARIEPQSLN